MRALAGAVLLLAGWPAVAQPNLPLHQEPVVAVPRPPPPRVGQPADLLRQDVTGLVAFLNSAMPEHFAGQQYIFGARVGYFGANEWHRWWLSERGNQKLVVNRIEVSDVTASTATVNVETHLTAPVVQPVAPDPDEVDDQPGPRETHKESFKARWAAATDQQHYWQLVPTLPAAGQWLSTAPLAWAVYMLAQQPGSQGAFRSQVALNKLKQLGLGFVMFVQDYDERIALAADFVEEALQPYLKQDSLWLIPGTTEHYSFNARLSDKSLAAVAEPARTVLFYEGADEKPVYRYGGKAAIGLVDGHVELADPQKVKSYLWHP